MSDSYAWDPGHKPPALDPALYPANQVLAAEGMLPADHPSWHRESGASRSRGGAITPPEADRGSEALGERGNGTSAAFPWVKDKVPLTMKSWLAWRLETGQDVIKVNAAGQRRQVAAEEVLPGYCRGCERRWSSTAWAHCSSCHMTCTSRSGFDRHRVGGACKLPADAGLQLVEGDVWRLPPAAVRPDNWRPDDR